MLKNKQKLQQYLEESNKRKKLYKPIFYRLNHKKINQEFTQLILQNKNLVVFDQINNQLKELLKSLSPDIKFSDTELEKAIKNHLAGASIKDYGVWVFYPWSNRLVHILDEDEFIALRTNRNRNKITAQEQKKLGKQKVAIIGLSVGQAIAITMAKERSFGEVRLADFDHIDLSNINRISTGIHNINTNKAITAARKIAEIDPFIKTKCYVNGVNESNIKQILFQGGKIDLLIDECDDLAMKVLLRKNAKSSKIPVVMAANERGHIDIERFDLENDRALFHGLLDHLNTDINHLKKKFPNEALPLDYLLALHPPATLSERMLSSLSEIGISINTWPQLASEVDMGAGIVTNVSRRILLKQLQCSGRYFINLNTIIK